MTDIQLTTDEAVLEQCAQLMCNSEPFTTLKFNIDKCRSAMIGPIKEVYVAYQENKFAGFVVLQFAGFMRGYIQTICLEPMCRGQGIGTALLKFSEEKFFKQFPNVFICVSSFNDGAQKLYHKLGYEKIGELKDHLTKGHDEYILRKQLSPAMEYTPAEER